MNDPILVIMREYNEHGRTGVSTFDVTTLDQILPRLYRRTIGTVRVTLDIAFPIERNPLPPCEWSSDMTLCRRPSAFEREIATVIGTDHVGTDHETPRLGRWRKKALCHEHMSRIQDHEYRGTVLIRQPQR